MPIRDSKIGKNTKIWHPALVNLYCCKIGTHCNIAAFVEIGATVEIGNRCRIQAFVFIPPGITIGNDVFLGPHVCFMNDKNPPTPVAQSKMAKIQKTMIEDKVVIGAGALIMPGVTIYKGAFIGAGAVITKDVKAGETVIGNPGRVMNNAT